MILVDTSAWVEFLRDTGSRECVTVDRLLSDRRLSTTDAVVMELLAGARDDVQVSALRGLLGRATLLGTVHADYLAAAALRRACRRGGETVRKTIDCLIAAVALRHGAALLHRDTDYDVLARHSALTVH